MINDQPSASRADYKNIIHSGCYIEANGVSICNLSDHLYGFDRSARYQVWSDKHNTYELYHNLDEAIDKFLELKRKVR